MKSVLAVLFALFASTHAAANNKTEANPLVRVMGLLKDLNDKLEKEAEEEKELWMKYKCWSDSTVSEKQSNIAKANDRISSLKSYIADVEGGKLTFTSNKADLEKELATVTADISNITDVRDEHHKVFEINKANEEEAVDALKDVIDVLKEHQAPSASLLQGVLRGRATSGSGAIARRKHAGLLNRALQISDKYLSKGNSHFLRRILTGQAENLVHTHTAASLDSDYMARVQGVTDELLKVEVGVENELKGDIKTESAEEKSFEETVESKEEQKATSEEMLEKLGREMAARAKAVEDSKAEVTTLEEQVAADEKMIEDVTKSLQAKETDFNERATYRQGEITAVGEAMEILNTDEARDTIRAATSFIQMSSISEERSRSASQALMSVYGSSKDSRLLAINAMLDLTRQGGAFDQIYDKIDAMIGVLNNEESKDLEIKDNCTRDKTKNEADKEELTNKLEDLSSTVAFSNDKIKDMNTSIASKEDQIAGIEAEMDKADSLRGKEQAEYNESVQLDQASILLLEQAAMKISDFYTSQKDASLIQKKAHTKKDEPEDAPDTWKEGGYNGAGSQSGGVVGTIKMLADDLKKEIAVAKKEEDEAIKDYTDAKADLEAQKEDLEAGISGNKGVKSQQVTNKEDAQTDIASKSGELAALEKTMADLLPGCSFYLENFESRSKNRQTEINGLLQAKSILKGSHAGL